MVTDIGRIEDVHFNPWFSTAKPFIFHQTTFGRAFVFGRSDWEYVFNTFAFGYAIGYHFLETRGDSGGVGSMNGNFLGIGQDLATNASVQVDASQPMGLLITNGEFTAFRAPLGAAFVDPNLGGEAIQVRVAPNNTGAVKFVDSAFWGPTDMIADIAGTGTTTFDACSFLSWDANKKGLPAIRQRGGNLVLTANDFFNGALQPSMQLELLPGGRKTIVTSNIFRGLMNISKKAADSDHKLAIELNLDDSPKLLVTNARPGDKVGSDSAAGGAEPGPLPVKLVGRDGTSSRRLRLASDFTRAELCAAVGLSADSRLQWRDDEGDWIELGKHDARELAEAKAVAVAGLAPPLLHVRVPQ